MLSPLRSPSFLPNASLRGLPVRVPNFSVDVLLPTPCILESKGRGGCWLGPIRGGACRCWPALDTWVYWGLNSGPPAYWVRILPRMHGATPPAHALHLSGFDTRRSWRWRLQRPQKRVPGGTGPGTKERSLVRNGGHRLPPRGDWSQLLPDAQWVQAWPPPQKKKSILVRSRRGARQELWALR
jgi:hypothetical protein